MTKLWKREISRSVDMTNTLNYSTNYYIELTLITLAVFFIVSHSCIAHHLLRLGPGGRRFDWQCSLSATHVAQTSSVQHVTIGCSHCRNLWLSCRPDEWQEWFLITLAVSFIVSHTCIAHHLLRLWPGGRRFESCRPDQKQEWFLNTLAVFI